MSNKNYDAEVAKAYDQYRKAQSQSAALERKYNHYNNHPDASQEQKDGVKNELEKAKENEKNKENELIAMIAAKKNNEQKQNEREKKENQSTNVNENQKKEQKFSNFNEKTEEKRKMEKQEMINRKIQEKSR